MYEETVKLSFRENAINSERLKISCSKVDTKKFDAISIAVYKLQTRIFSPA